MTNTTTTTTTTTTDITTRLERSAARRRELAKKAMDLSQKEGEILARIEQLEEQLKECRAELHRMEIEQVRTHIAYEATFGSH